MLSDYICARPLVGDGTHTMGVHVHGHGPGPGHGGAVMYRVGSSNMFGNLDDTATKDHVLGLTLDEMRKEYEYGVESVMNDMSLRGPEGRLKLK